MVVANLPYNIATPLLVGWLRQAAAFEHLVLMFQLEVAERICANPGTHAYGRLSVLVQWRCTARILGDSTRVSTVFLPLPREVKRGRRRLGEGRRRVHRADSADEPVAVPQRDQAPRLLASDPGQHSLRRFSPAVFGVQACPGKDSFGGGVAAAASRADSTFGVERPAHDAGALEHRQCLVRDVRDHAHQLVAG